MFSARNKIQKAFVFGHSLEYNGKKYSMSSSYKEKIVVMQCVENTVGIRISTH